MSGVGNTRMRVEVRNHSQHDVILYSSYGSTRSRIGRVVVAQDEVFRMWRPAEFNVRFLLEVARRVVYVSDLLDTMIQYRCLRVYVMPLLRTSYIVPCEDE